MRCARLVSLLVGSVALTSAAQAGGYNWSGLYLGAHGGFAWSDFDYPGTNPYVAPPGACKNAFGPGQDCGSPRPDLKGGLVGGQIGYNLQIHQIVIGAEADISFTNMEETVRDGNYLTQTHTIDRLGSVRARLGYAFDRFLPYGTVGWGWADASLGEACPGDAAAVQFGICRPAANGGFGSYDKSQDKTESGWVYGGGVEMAIADNWTLRGEYLRFDLGKETYELGTVPSGKTIGSKVVDRDVDVVRFGVNYKFGGREEPVPLK